MLHDHITVNTQVYLCQLLTHTHTNSKTQVLPWEALAVHQSSYIGYSSGVKFREASMLLGVFWFNCWSGNLGGEREKKKKTFATPSLPSLNCP